MPIHDTDKHVFSERIKQLRLDRSLTQKQMAGILKISERNYQNFESGRYFPSNNTMMSIINNFGTEIFNYLVGAENK